MTTAKPINVIVVEDDSGQAVVTRRAFGALKLSLNLFVCQRAEEALARLKLAAEIDSDIPLPDLVLTDVRLPGMSGYDLTRAIKANVHLHDIPVMIYTGYPNPRNIESVYAVGGDGLFDKDDIQKGVLAAVRLIRG